MRGLEPLAPPQNLWGSGGGVLEINIKLGLRVENQEELENLKSATGPLAYSIL